jgi:hypothetical protein
MFSQEVSHHKTIPDEKKFFNDFIKKYPEYNSIDFNLYKDLHKTQLALLGSFLNILKKGVVAAYSPNSVMPVGKGGNAEYLTYDLLRGNLVGALPESIDTVLVNDLLWHDGPGRFEKIFQSNDKINIKFDVSQKKKNELGQVHRLLQDLKNYAVSNPGLKIFCSFYNDGGISKDEITSGNYAMLDFDGDRFSKILQNEQLNIITVSPTDNHDTLFRKTSDLKNNVFVIEIPECVNSKDLIYKKITELVDDAGLRMNYYITYKIVKNKNKDNKIYFIPASASPIYASDDLILNNDINIDIANRKIEDSSLLKKLASIGKDLILKKQKFNSVASFVDFINGDLFTHFILLATEQSSLSGEKIISFNSYENTIVIKKLIKELAEHIDMPHYLNTKEVLSIPDRWNNKLIYVLKDLNVKNNNHIIFAYTNKDKKSIEEYKENDRYIFFTHKELQAKRKNRIVKSIIKEMGEISRDNQLEHDLKKAYDEMIYPGMFSDTDLIDFTKKIYFINSDKRLSVREKVSERINLTAQFCYTISEHDIKKFNDFSENKNNMFFFNHNVELSDKEADLLLYKYSLYDSHLEEICYYLHDQYSEDKKKLRRLVANLLKNNTGCFKADKKYVNDNLAMLKKMVAVTNVGLCSNFISLFNNRFESNYGSGALQKQYLEYKEKSAKSPQNDRSVTMLFPDQKSLNDADSDLVPEILRLDIYKNIEAFRKNKGEGKCILESVSGEPGVGKSNSFPFEIKCYKKLCVELGIDPDNVEPVIIQGIGSSFIMGGSEQATDIWNVIDAAINEKPDVKICILFDEADKAFLDNRKQKKDVNSNQKVDDKFKVDFQTTWKDRFDPTGKHKNVSVKYCSNTELDLFLDPAIKSRTTGKEKILHISKISVAVIESLLKKELIKNNIKDDLPFTYHDLMKIKFLVGNQQRNKDLFQDVINKFVEKFPNKKDQNYINFISVIDLKYKNKIKRYHKNLLSLYDAKKMSKIEAEKGFNPGELLKFFKASDPLGNKQDIYDAFLLFLNEQSHLNIISGVGASCLIKKFIFSKDSASVPPANLDSEKEKERWAWSFLFGALISGLPTLLVDAYHSGEGFNYLFDMNHVKEAYTRPWKDYFSGNFLKRPEPLKTYQNLDYINELKSDDYATNCALLSSQLATYAKPGNLYDNLKAHQKIDEDYFWGDLEEEEVLFAKDTKVFVQLAIDHRLKKFKEFELYVKYNCPKITEFLNQIGQNKDVGILGEHALKNLFFDNIFDGKKNNYIFLRAIDQKIEDIDKNLQIKKRFVQYHNNIYKLRNNKLNDLDAIILKKNIGEEGDDLWYLLNRVCADTKQEVPIQKYYSLLGCRVNPEYSSILLKDRTLAERLDVDFSKQVAKELEEKDIVKQTEQQDIVEDDEDDE